MKPRSQNGVWDDGVWRVLNAKPRSAMVYKMVVFCGAALPDRLAHPAFSLIEVPPSAWKSLGIRKTRGAGPRAEKKRPVHGPFLIVIPSRLKMQTASNWHNL